MSFLALSFSSVASQRHLRHTSRVNQIAIGSKSQDGKSVVELLRFSPLRQFLVGFGKVASSLDADLYRHLGTMTGLFIDVLDA